VARDRAVWPILLGIIIVASVLLTRSAPAAPSGASVGGSFRALFWGDRGLDLLVQAGLILAGALGIAALLPRGSEEE
jgi:hypothetical protein